MDKGDHKKKALITSGSPVKAMRCIRRNWTMNERARPSARHASLHTVPWPSNGADILDTTLSSTGLFLWLIPATVENMEDKRSRELWLNLKVWIQILKPELQSQTSKHASTKLMVSQFSDTECQKVPNEVFVGCKFLALIALILALKFKIASWL